MLLTSAVPLSKPWIGVIFMMCSSQTTCSHHAVIIFTKFVHAQCHVDHYVDLQHATDLRTQLLVTNRRKKEGDTTTCTRGCSCWNISRLPHSHTLPHEVPLQPSSRRQLCRGRAHNTTFLSDMAWPWVKKTSTTVRMRTHQVNELCACVEASHHRTKFVQSWCS